MGLKEHFIKTFSYFLQMIKSDQNGIESHLFFHCALCKQVIKSDQNGIESGYVDKFMFMWCG